jgi:CO/xanthine dehydrogenase FAD-binding subunit
VIIEYFRPENLEEALGLLARTTPKTVPLGGGTILNAPSDQQVAAVDLQGLGMNKIEKRGRSLTLGATVTLQALLETVGIQPALAEAVRLESAYNLRQSGTVAGSLVSGSGRSPFLTAMLALDADLHVHPVDQTQPLGEFLPLRGGRWPGALITQVSLSLHTELAYHYSARTPADRPVTCAAAARWPSGRTRIVLGGYGKAPLTILDGEANEGVLDAAEAAYMTAGDEWASAEYRAHTAKVLVRRCLETFG